MQGRDEEALRLTELAPERLTVPEDATPKIGWRRVRAKLLARAGELDEAERLGREAVALAERTDYLDVHAQAVADLGEVLRLAGRPEESAAALERRFGSTSRKGTSPPPGGCVGSSSSLRPRREAAVKRPHDEH